MKQPGVLASLITFVAAVSFVVASQEAKNEGVVSAMLSGTNEVSGVADADGTGVFEFTVKNEEQQFCYDLSVSNIAAPNRATINSGAKETNGRVVLDLVPPTNGRSQGCISSNVETLADIDANPSRYYVNVTNDEFPTGAIRGQLK